MPEMRYVNYGRVSSVKQKDEETIEMQQDALRAFAEYNRLTIVDEYYDEAQSGTLPFADRPEGRRLLQDARTKKFDAVLFYRTDRLGRSAFEGLRICQQLSDLGIAIRSISENYDTSTPTGKLVFTMLLALAENELSTIKKRMNDGKQRKLRRGFSAVVGNPPYGYVRSADLKLVIDDTKVWGEMTKADVVRYIYETTAKEGLGSVAMAARLNELRIPSGNDGYWSSTTVLNVLRNTKYKGIAYFNRASKLYDDIIEIAVPPIVSPELWQQAYDGRKFRKVYNRHAQNLHHYLLGQGLVRCAHCGRAYVGVYYKRIPATRTQRFYKCNGKAIPSYYAARGEPLCTKALPLPADWLEKTVWDECCKLLTNTEYLNEVLQAYYSESDRGYTRIDTSDLESAVKEAQKQREELISLRLKGIITEEDIVSRLPMLDAQIESLKKQIAEALQKPVNNIDEEIRNTKDAVLQLKKALPKATDFETKRAIVQALVSSVQIKTNEDRTFDIDVTLNFGPQGLGQKLTELVRRINLDTRTKASRVLSKISNSYTTCFNDLGSNDNLLLRSLCIFSDHSK